MRTIFYFLLALFAATLALVGLTACGSSGDTGNSVATQTSRAGDSSSDEGPVVARVGYSSITGGTLNHWMATIIGGDYDENIGHPAPRGLVSDPPNYPRCVAAIESLGPPKTANESLRKMHARLESDCRELYQDLKQQALAYLIHGLWNIEEASEERITITNAEIQKSLQKLEAERYPNKKAFADYLAGREWSLSDELYLVKRDLLDEKLAASHERALRKSIKGSQEVIQRANVELYLQTIKKWKARTTCLAGYVIPECKQYAGPETTGAPDALLEQIASSR